MLAQFQASLRATALNETLKGSLSLPWRRWLRRLGPVIDVFFVCFCRGVFAAMTVVPCISSRSLDSIILIAAFSLDGIAPTFVSFQLLVGIVVVPLGGSYINIIAGGYCLRLMVAVKTFSSDTCPVVSFFTCVILKRFLHFFPCCPQDYPCWKILVPFNEMLWDMHCWSHVSSAIVLLYQRTLYRARPSTCRSASNFSTACTCKLSMFSSFCARQFSVSRKPI